MSQDHRPLEDWAAATLRLTAFPSPHANPNSFKGWEDLVGETPEMRQEQPRTNELVEAGDFKRGILRMLKDPVRLDLRYQYRSDSSRSQELPILGTFGEEVEAFLPVATKWLQDTSNLQRIAFGSVLFLKIDDMTAGYTILDGYLPSVTLDPDGSSEFLYRINRRRKSQACPETLMINRLSTWSVVSFAEAILDLGSVSPGTANVQRRASMCRLELDINTVPEPGQELPTSRLSELFEELVTLGKEIAENGDVP